MALVDAVVVVEDTVAVQQSISELSFVFELTVGPEIDSFAVEQCILELSLVVVAIGSLEEAPAVNDVGKHITLVSVLDLLSGRGGLLDPGHLSMTMHL